MGDQTQDQVKQSYLSDTKAADVSLEWIRKENEKGIIYYLSSGKEISMTHPDLNKIFAELDASFANVKIAEYRTALKLRYLQLQLGLHWINFSGIHEAFPLRGNQEEEDKDCMSRWQLTYIQVYGLIETAFRASLREEVKDRDISRAADLTLSFIVNVYDSCSSGRLTMKCVMNILVALCGAKLSDKYQFFRYRLQDKSGNIYKERLTHLIDDLMKIPIGLKEVAFGIDVDTTVDSCFNKSASDNPESIDQSCFYTWLSLEPQSLLWLPTLHRTIATETVRHATRCAVCKAQPIIGFRYKCLICFGYDLCQHCFLLGQFSDHHKLRHPVKEYCLPMTACDNTKAFFKIVKNKLLRRTIRRMKGSYLTVEHKPEPKAKLDWEPKSINADETPSTDSGVEQEDLSQSAGVSQQMEPGLVKQTEMIEAIDRKMLLKPALLVGQPSDFSSPVPASGPLDMVNGVLSKLDIAIQQKEMEQKIKELQEENRMLSKKLEAFQRCYNLSESGTEDMTTDSPISPIKDVTGMETAGRLTTTHETMFEQSTSRANTVTSNNTLAIVGTFTPVRALSSSAPNGDLTETDHDTVDCTGQYGLQYRSSDMSLLSRDESGSENCLKSVTLDNSEDDEKRSTRISVNESEDVSNVSENYKPSDMSLLCFGLANMKTGKDSETCEKNQYNPHQSYQGGSTFTSPAVGMTSDTSIELSDIKHTGNSTVEPFFTHDPKLLQSLAPTPEQFITASRRRTIEPVHMSTPVLFSTNTKRSSSNNNVNATEERSKSVLRVQCLKAGQMKDNFVHDKENVTPSRGVGVHPSVLSAIDDYSQRRILVCTPSSNKLSPTSEVNTPLSQSSGKAEIDKSNQSDCSKTCNQPKHVYRADTIKSFHTEKTHSEEMVSCADDGHSMMTKGQSELHKMMADFERECKITDNTQAEMTRALTGNDSSVMAAAYNIGDALSEFVQAVAKCDEDGNKSLVTETTQF